MSGGQGARAKGLGSAPTQVESATEDTFLPKAPTPVLKRLLADCICQPGFLDNNAHLTIDEFRGLGFRPLAEMYGGQGFLEPDYLDQMKTFRPSWKTKEWNEFSKYFRECFVQSAAKPTSSKVVGGFIQSGNILTGGVTDEGNSIRQHFVLAYDYTKSSIDFPESGPADAEMANQNAKPVFHSFAPSAGKDEPGYHARLSSIPSWGGMDNGMCPWKEGMSAGVHIISWWYGFRRINGDVGDDTAEATIEATGVLMKVTSHVMNGFVASSRDFNYENLIKETQFDNMTRMACMAAMMKAHGWDVDNANNRFKEFIRAQRAAASLEAEGPHDAEIEDFIKSQSQPVLTQSMSDNINIVKAFCKFTHSNKPCRFWEDAWGPIPATIVYRSPKDKTIVSPKPPAKRGRPSAPGPSDTKGKAV